MPTNEEIKSAIVLFVIQIFNYGIMVINFRAVAQAHYVYSAISDFALASMSFFVIRKISKSEDSLIPWLAYALGGVVGSILGIYLSLLIHGK